jgi:hypothetical protein
VRARRVDRAALLLAAVPLLYAGSARGYCRTTTCDDCPRDDNGCLDGGTEVAWPGRCVALGIDADGSEQVDVDTIQALTAQAMSSWNAVRCEPSGEPPSIELVALDGLVVCGRSEFASDSANANVLVFRDHAWPYDGSGRELASTTVRSRPAGGAIVDADIEINATMPLLVGETDGQGTIVGAHDLLSILTHELGHFLGLDHSNDPESIMQIELPARAVRTDLGADDVAGICAAYPPERDALPCDPMPRGEFSAQCALDPSTGGACSVARPGAVSGAPVPSLLAWPAALALAWLRLRLRQRRRADAHSRSGLRRPCFHSRR